MNPKRPASSDVIAVAICLVAFAAPLAAQGIEFMPFGGYRFGGDFFDSSPITRRTSTVRPLWASW